jgi:hypothetical protein
MEGAIEESTEELSATFWKQSPGTPEAFAESTAITPPDEDSCDATSTTSAFSA